MESQSRFTATTSLALCLLTLRDTWYFALCLLTVDSEGPPFQESLLLMSQNFYQLDDAFQASFILESIVANFAQFPEIVEQAQLDLANLKALESKNNSSIKVEEENEN